MFHIIDYNISFKLALSLFLNIIPFFFLSLPLFASCDLCTTSHADEILILDMYW